LLPEQARVHFQTKGETRLEVEEVLATSTDIKLDYTIVRVKKLPKKVEALETGTAPESLPHPPGRVYVIGHPAGRDLEFSLQDNEMLACNERLLHYRAPTEGGSSGSPVFESDDWRVIALHHAGGQNIPKLDASGDGYAANEGISLAAIGRDIRQRLE
jgi:V8-like Glu-specific endopeptidase